MFEDTPEFVARRLIREAKNYLDGIRPPFLTALLDYAQEESIVEALGLRHAMCKVGEQFEREDWWFTVWDRMRWPKAAWEMRLTG